MTVPLTGRDLDRHALVRVARNGETVSLDPTAIEQMLATRRIVEAALSQGDPVYGLNTGVGVLKRVAVEADDAAGRADRMLLQHRVAQGPPASTELVRATMVRLANHFAEGSAGVRPSLAERIVVALNEGEVPVVRTLGSIGQADLAPLADLAIGLFSDMELEAGEGLALLGSNAFSTAWAALAVSDADDLLGTLEIAGALSLEGLAANLSVLHPRIAEVRPYPGLRESLTRLRLLLDGSSLWEPGAPRQLQDPLTFRNLPQVAGACRDVLGHVDRQLAVELNASQGNPIVVPADDRVISVANFEVLPLAAALDYLRLVLATALGSSAERSVKLLETSWSGLPTGLTPATGTADAGLAYLGIAAQSLAVEGRLLAQPVSFEIVSTAHAEGIEDRATMAPLAARRVAEQVDLGRRLAAIELVVAAQAADLGGTRLGRGTGRAHALVRERVPFLATGDLVPDVEALVDLLRDGGFPTSVVADERAANEG